MAVGGAWREYLALAAGRQRRVRVEPDGADLRVRVDGEEFHVACETRGEGETCLLLNGRPQVLHIRADGAGRFRVSLGGGEVGVEIAEGTAARPGRAGSLIRHDREIEIRAPMPGTIVAVQVAEGTEVREEAPICVLEAMKMQNALTSPARGLVRRLLVAPGQTVEGDALLAVLERSPEA